MSFFLFIHVCCCCCCCFFFFKLFTGRPFCLSLFQSLLLLTYLVKNGSERVVTNTRDHIYDLRQLENFSHFDEFGKDQGVNSMSMIKVYLVFV